MNPEIEQIDLKIRSLMEDVEAKKISANDARAKHAELIAQRTLLKQADIKRTEELAARAERPDTWDDVVKLIKEKRAVTLNGAGGAEAFDDIAVSLGEKGGFLSQVSMYTTESASAVVPVLTPSLAVPAKQADGATSIAADSTAVFAGRSLTMYPYYSELVVSRNANDFSSLKTKLPGIFADAFRRAMVKAALVGTAISAGGLGIFVADAAGVTTSQDVDNAANTGLSAADLFELCELVRALDAEDTDMGLFIHPTRWTAIHSDATNTADYIREEYARFRTFDGIKLWLSSSVPSGTTSGHYPAVVGVLRHIAIAYAKEMSLVPFEVSGSANTNYKAIQYLNCSPTCGDSFRRAKNIS